MRTRTRTALFAAATLAVALTAGTASAQQAPPPPPPPGIRGDLFRDLQEVEQKLVGLAEAMPDDKYAWRPGEGVRSVGEVFAHVAADNYFLPTLLGVEAPASTGIRAGSYETAEAFEKRPFTKAETVAALKSSFEFLRQALAETPDSRMNEQVDFFGRPAPVSRVWVLTTTHTHEHLGQSIAYARTNGIVPPWSR